MIVITFLYWLGLFTKMYLINRKKIISSIQCTNGDKNITYSFLYCKLKSQFKFSWLIFKYDGLPRRLFNIGPIELCWGQDHDWICEEK